MPSQFRPLNPTIIDHLNHSTLVFLDYFFLVFHSAFSLFVVFGWIWRGVRRAHLWAVLLTLFSWVVLGIWYGFGYCFLTHWHWEVRSALGAPPDSSSYIHFLILETTGLELDPMRVDQVTVVVFVLCLLLTSWMNYRDQRCL